MNARFAFLGLVLASVIGLSACSSGSDGAGGWPATKVALAPVERAQAPRAFHGVGGLEAARQVELASETAGRVTRIAFTSGQRVKQGDLLVQLNDAPEQAERLRLRAQLRNAETVLARTRLLVADKVATQEQLDHAQAARDMAQGELRGIEAVIAQKAIRAPFAGTIGIRRVHEGKPWLRAMPSPAWSMPAPCTSTSRWRNRRFRTCSRANQSRSGSMPGRSAVSRRRCRPSIR